MLFSKKHRRETTTNGPAPNSRPAFGSHSYAQDPSLGHGNNDPQNTEPLGFAGDPSITGVRFGGNPHYPDGSDGNRTSLKSRQPGQRLTNPLPLSSRDAPEAWSTQATPGDTTEPADPNRSNKTDTTNSLRSRYPQNSQAFDNNMSHRATGPPLHPTTVASTDIANRQGMSGDPPTTATLSDPSGAGPGSLNSQELKDLANKRARESAALKKQGVELAEAERLEKVALAARERAVAHGAHPSHGALYGSSANR